MLETYNPEEKEPVSEISSPMNSVFKPIVTPDRSEDQKKRKTSPLSGNSPEHIVKLPSPSNKTVVSE
jgi:hypothetical protein